jgi:ABC-type Fe3+ transport system substrate-binding protein
MKQILTALIVFTIFFAVHASAQGQSAANVDIRARMIAQAQTERTVVVVGSQTLRLDQNLKGFKKRFPFITIKGVEASTTKTVDRVVAEAKSSNVSVDAVHVSEEGAVFLANHGILAKNEFPHLKDFYPNTQPKSGLYVVAFLTPRIQAIYNTTLIRPTDIPKNWDQLVDKKFIGQVLIANNIEDVPLRLAWLWRKDSELDWNRAFDYFGKVSTLKPLLATSFTDAAQRMVAGEGMLNLFPSLGTTTDLYLKGAPVRALAFPKYFHNYRTWMIPKAGKHPASAWLLIDYMTSPEGQFEYTDVFSSQIQLNKTAKPGKLSEAASNLGVRLEDIDVVSPDYAANIFTEANAKKSEEFFFKALGIK